MDCPLLSLHSIPFRLADIFSDRIALAVVMLVASSIIYIPVDPRKLLLLAVVISWSLHPSIYILYSSRTKMTTFLT